MRIRTQHLISAASRYQEQRLLDYLQKTFIPFYTANWRLRETVLEVTEHGLFVTGELRAKDWQWLNGACNMWLHCNGHLPRKEED